MGAAFAWGTSTVFSKIALQSKPDKFVTGLRFGLTTVFGLLAVLATNQVGVIATITASQLLIFGAIALSTGMVALAIYYKGLALVEAKIATILELIFPVTAVLIDAVVYKSILAPSQYLAALVLLFAAYKLSLLRSERVSFSSKNIRGKGRGKPMGFPTINLAIPKDFSLREGIYAAYVTLAGKTYKGALHYGPVPTYNESKKSLEVYLLDTKDIKDSVVAKSSIQVDIVQRLRSIESFSSTAALVEQIEVDVQRTKGIL